MIRGIVFDLDDTLYPYDEYLESGFLVTAKYLGAKYGVDPRQALEYMKALHSRRKVKEVFSNTVKRFKLDSAVAIELVSVFRKHKPVLALFSGYRPLLDALARSYILGLLVDGEPDVQERKITALRIDRYFKSLLYAGKYEDSKAKPHPFLYQLMARVMGLHPKETVFVADNPFLDFIGARKAGFLTVRTLTGEYADKESTTDFDADHRIQDLHALPEVLRLYE
ncbi:MAG: HAD family hydrolase [Acidobacteria bacterium]|nr:HAD family hydrolase [Acidobacteriota bacterium]